jgi:glycerol-3-phosphate cytidylyltransferase
MITGFSASTFDLLHAGHIQMLKESKENCDFLIVGLHIDPSIERAEKNTPVQTIVERYVQIEAVKYVDSVIPYSTEEDLLNILKMFNINIRFIGEEYRYKIFTGKSYCIENDIELFYNSRRHDFSSSGLRTKIANAEDSKELLTEDLWTGIEQHQLHNPPSLDEIRMNFDQRYRAKSQT